MSSTGRDLLERARHELTRSRLVRRAFALAGRRPFTPPVGKVRFGDLGDVRPVAWVWGADRGGALDRVYIERFLGAHAADVRGHVLEIGENVYTYRFGGDRVTKSDVLHVDPDHPGATMAGDLVDGSFLPEGAFDCVILTQTLQYVSDPGAALRATDRALAPDGVLLLSVPGISVVETDAYDGAWNYMFSANGIRRLLRDHLPGFEYEVASHGNALVATAFLQGLGVDDLPEHATSIDEPAYAIVHTARARRRTST